MILLSLALALAPIIDAEGHHATAFDFGCADPLYCEEFTGIPPILGSTSLPINPTDPLRSVFVPKETP